MPKEPKPKQMNFVIDPKLDKWVESECARLDQTKQEFMNTLIRDAKDAKKKGGVK